MQILYPKTRGIIKGQGQAFNKPRNTFECTLIQNASFSLFLFSIFSPLFVPCWVLLNNMIKGITLKETAKNVCQGFINTSFPSSFPFLSFVLFPACFLSFPFLFHFFSFFLFFLFSSLSTCAF